MIDGRGGGPPGLAVGDGTTAGHQRRPYSGCHRDVYAPVAGTAISHPARLGRPRALDQDVTDSQYLPAIASSLVASSPAPARGRAE